MSGCPWKKYFCSWNKSKTTTAHPRSNITPCPSCNHPHCTIHANNFRKWFHQTKDAVLVQRRICGSCGRTHSILPKNLFPICRWWLDDILKICAWFADGESIYAIAKRLGESPSSLRNLKAWVVGAGATILELTLGANLLEETPPRATPTTTRTSISLVRLWPTWTTFTHSFSRAFYPKRFLFLPTHTILTG